jgi:hypothetical protein
MSIRGNICLTGNVPLQNLTAASTKFLRKDQAVIVYCWDYQCDLSAEQRGVWKPWGFKRLTGTHRARQMVCRRVGDRRNRGKESPNPRNDPQGSADVLLRERLEDVKSRRNPNEDLCVVVNDRNIVLGVIEGETWDANPQSRIADIMQPGPRTIRPDLEPKDAQKALRNYDGPSAIVTTSDGELLGVVKIAQKKAQKGHQAA